MLFQLLNETLSFSEEEDLNLPLDDDAFLLKFLRPCKFYHESTFRLVRNYPPEFRQYLTKCFR